MVDKKEKNVTVITNTEAPVVLSKKEEKEKRLKEEEMQARRLMRKAEDEHLQFTMLNKKTPFDITEAYKATRTNIMFSLKTGEKCKSIVVSSANPGEGKSTSCINLAISFAQMGDRVVIIDADMRKPRIHKYFKVKNKKGLSNILGGFETLENCVIHNEETGLDVITAGNIPPNPAELLASSEMDALLTHLSEIYDYVFVDTPPINVVTDAAILSKKVTGVVLVVRHNVTNKDAVERSVNTLEFAGAKLVGFLLNSVERKVYEGRYTYRSYRRGYKRYGYGKYGYKRYGYGKYGYSRYGYSRYGYSRYGYSRYGYSNRYGYGDQYDEERENTETATRE